MAVHEYVVLKSYGTTPTDSLSADGGSQSIESDFLVYVRACDCPLRIRDGAVVTVISGDVKAYTYIYVENFSPFPFRDRGKHE